MLKRRSERLGFALRIAVLLGFAAGFLGAGDLFRTKRAEGGPSLAAQFWIREVLATRNGTGTHSLPSGNPVVTNTTISSTMFNATMSDFSAEITDSLSRSGKGGMTAALKMPNGTVALPSWTFNNDTNSGIYLETAGATADVRMSVDGVYVQKWLAAGTTIPVALTTTAGITATGTTNGNGITATGTGTGNGITATGGATNGDGVSGIGVGTGDGVNGAGSAAGSYGVAGFGTAAFAGVAGTGGGSNGTGVFGTGGTSNGAGIHGAGTGTGQGGLFFGGSTSGAGVFASAGAPNGNGVVGSGSGTGYGVDGSGGSSNGTGVRGTGGSTNGVGVLGTGAGSGAGVSATGGTTGTGGTFAAGTAATASARTDAVTATNGDLAFVGVANPNTSVGLTNRLTPANIVKAWAMITGANGASSTVSAGFNITSAACAASNVTITMTSPMASASYAVIGTGKVSDDVVTVAITSSSVFVVDLDGAGVDIDLCGASLPVFYVMAIGLQ